MPRLFSKSPFFRHAALLFLSLRVADLFAILASVYLVPRYVKFGELGAVLPLITFTTALAFPAYAFAVVLMREANRLAAQKSFGKLKSLLAGAFLGTFALLILSLVLAAALLPRFAARMNLTAPRIAFLALASSFLGCFAPVYMDALNGLKRFGAYGLTEILSGFLRFAVLALLMPLKGLAGFFIGNAVQPLVRIASSLVGLKDDLAVPRERYWTMDVARRHALAFVGVLFALGLPLWTSSVEQSLIRTALPVEVSAKYYLATRLTDLLNYLTLPLMLVLFPYAAEATEKGRRPLVVKSILAAAVGAVLLGVVALFWGNAFVGWMVSLSGEAKNVTVPLFTFLLPLLAGFAAAVQVFGTNSRIAVGNYRFLWGFIPLHLIYIVLLHAVSIGGGLEGYLLVFAAFGVIRALLFW